MTDDSLKTLKATIRKLFLPGPVQKRWLAWAERIQDGEAPGTA